MQLEEGQGGPRSSSVKGALTLDNPGVTARSPSLTPQTSFPVGLIRACSLGTHNTHSPQPHPFLVPYLIVTP